MRSDMVNQEVYVGVELTDGSYRTLCVFTRARGSRPPYGADWHPDPVWRDYGWWLRPATDAVILSELVNAFKSVNAKGEPLPTVSRWKLLTNEEALADQTYRGARYLDADRNLRHDMARARDIHRGLLRQARDLAFKKLDGQWMRAQGRGDAEGAAAVEAQRQALRDAPADPALEAAASLDEVRACWPAELPRLKVATEPRAK